MSLDRRRVSALLGKVFEVFASEPQLIEHDRGDFLVVGDTHGDLDSTLKAVDYAEREGLNLIFLGDYVDRGPKQVENIVTLFELKLSWGRRLTLLRGNHETSEMNRWYGFYNVVSSTYGSDFYPEFAKVFAQLPYAALLRGKIFCVHGGIPQGMKRVEEVRDFPKGEVDPRDLKVLQLIWNDPSEDIEYFAPSWRGGGARLYGWRAFEEFMDANKLDLMIRSHEPQDKGYGYLFNRRLLTVFSCRYYGIRPAAALIKGEQVEIISLE